MPGKDLNVNIFLTKPMEDMLMNQFRMFQEPLSNVSPETVMASNESRIKRLFQETAQTNCTAGNVWLDAQTDSCKGAVIDFDTNDCSKGLRCSIRKGPEKEMFDLSKDTTNPRSTPNKRQTLALNQ